MGLLDEAIREHLDLKRRRGADPTEVERAEREALGPVRRAPEASSSNEVAEDPGHEPGLAYDHEEGAGGTPESLKEEPGAEPYDGPEQPAPVPELVDDPFAEPQPPAAMPVPEPDPVPPPLHPVGEETMEYDVEAALGSEGHREAGDGEEGDAEDVLEETPEFLQDTPDHDRLWFEQRPPKDFDFEG
jgi:hypothetical protein